MPLTGDNKGRLEAARSFFNTPGAFTVPPNQRQLGRLWNDPRGFVAPSLHRLTELVQRRTRAVWIGRFGLHGREAAAAAEQLDRRAREGGKICYLMLNAAG